MTHKEVAKLTDEAIVIAVLKAIGFERADEWKVMTNQFVDRPTWDAGFLLTPNYPQDLNACHEFEVAMPDEQAFLYGHNLMAILTRDKSRALISATARQRCEAFVMTMMKGGTT